MPICGPIEHVVVYQQALVLLAFAIILNMWLFVFEDGLQWVVNCGTICKWNDLHLGTILVTASFNYFDQLDLVLLVLYRLFPIQKNCLRREHVLVAFNRTRSNWPVRQLAHIDGVVVGLRLQVEQAPRTQLVQEIILSFCSFLYIVWQIVGLTQIHGNFQRTISIDATILRWLLLFVSVRTDLLVGQVHVPTVSHVVVVQWLNVLYAFVL